MASGFFSQFTPDQLRRQYARNAVGLRRMADRALRTGRKVNGFTGEHLDASAKDYARMSTASDDEIRARIGRRHQ